MQQRQSQTLEERLISRRKAMGLMALGCLSLFFGCGPKPEYRVRLVFVETFYIISEPADEIMPGLRVHDFGVGILTDGFGLHDKQWVKKYNSSDGELKKIFRELDKNQIIRDDVAYQFDFNKFDNYWVNFKGNGGFVAFRTGYLTWSAEEEKRVKVPHLFTEATEQIIKKTKIYALPLDSPTIENAKKCLYGSVEGSKYEIVE